MGSPTAAVADGYRESNESWQEVRRDLNKRGMRATRVATGGGALRFWRPCEAWLTTREERCGVHKIANFGDAYRAHRAKTWS